MTYIPTEKVESSNIEEIGYHRQTQTLRIIFQEGRAYDYPLVPEREYNKLMAAESKGRFFNSRIKTLYGHRTVRPEQLKEPCCDHPADATCSDACYPCDAWCCPGGPSDAVREAITAGLRRGHQIVNPKTVGDTPTEEWDEEREAVIDTVCRCCGKSIRIPPEDAVELCGLCFGGKGGDTNEQCTEHHDRRDDCPHGADGRDCESSCGCACHTGASD